jgi:Type II secretion system (T2SS), protein M subtype b
MSVSSKWFVSTIGLVALPMMLICFVSWYGMNKWQDNVFDLALKRARLQGVVDYGGSPNLQVSANTNARDHLVGSEDTPSQRAALQSKIKDLAAQRGLQILQASEVATETVVEPLKRIRLRFELTGIWTDALRFAEDIETQNSWLFIDTVTLRSFEQEGVQPTGEPQVQMSIAISGLVAPMQPIQAP